MAWIELKFITHSQLAEKLTAILETCGAIAVTLQDAGNQPLYEPEATAVWDDVQITGLFNDLVDTKSILTTVTTQFPQLTPQINFLAEQEWERVWMQDFKAMSFGKRLWVIPSYLAQNPSPNHIILDPGLAFGTGKHPTTAMCLHWLDEHINNQAVVIDYGCGSGILAIAAIKLGAQKVYAIDHDPQALTATSENAQRNGLNQSQIITTGPTEFAQFKVQADLLIANILAQPLIELAAFFSALLRPNGQIVLSGILEEQVQSIIDAYQSWFKIETIAQQDEWICLSGVKFFLQNSR